MKRIFSVVLVGLSVLGSPLSPAAAQPAYSTAATEVAGKLALAFPEVKGLVLALLPDGRILLDLTAKAGAYTGLEVEAFRAGDEFRHPISGEVLGRLHVTVGTLRVTEVQEKFSIAMLVSAAQDQQLRAGDGVRVSGARILLGLAKAGSSGAGDAETRSATRDLEVALARTGRFEVVDERRMRSALVKANLAADLPLTDPKALEVLRRELRLSVLALPRISPQEDRTFLDVEVVSTLSGHAILLASVEVPGPGTAVAAKQAPAPKAPAASPPPAPAPPAPAPEGHRTPAWIGSPGTAGKEAQETPGITVNPEFGARSESAGRAYAVQSLPAGTIAMDFGDVDGDGQDELVAITKNEVLVFKRTGGLFALGDRIRGAAVSEYLSVGVADVNGNGKAEIFVSNADVRDTSFGISANLQSFVLEEREGRIVPIWEGVPTYFRVLKSPEYPEGLLLVQHIGIDEPYRGGVMRYRWGGKGYVQDPSFRLSNDQKGIHGFTLVDLNGDGVVELVKIGSDGAVRVLDQAGRQIAETEESFGIFPHISLRLPLSPNEKMDHPLTKKLRPQEAFKRFVLDRPLVVTPFGPKGRPGILVGRNVAAKGIARLLSSLELIEGGNVIHLAWDGGTLRKQWQTEYKEEMYIADYGIFRLDGDLAIAVLTHNPRFFRRTEATLEVYRISGTPQGSPGTSVAR